MFKGIAGIASGALLALGLSLNGTVAVAAEYDSAQERAVAGAMRLFHYYNDEQNRITKELVHIQSNFLERGLDSTERKRLGEGLAKEIIFYRDRAAAIGKTDPRAYLEKLGYKKVGKLSAKQAKECTANAHWVSARPAIVTVKHRVEVKKAASEIMRGIDKRSLSDSVGKSYNVRVAEIVKAKTDMMELEVHAVVEDLLAKCNITR